MFRKTTFTGIFIALLCIAYPDHADCQVTVNGPSCVLPGTVYQYTIGGEWDSASAMQVCISGGVIRDVGNNCTPNGRPLAFVQVMWDSSGTGKLALTSSSGNYTLDVNITAPLSGGAINSSVKNQSILYDAMPADLNCSAASGGSCAPRFSYQWQESIDMISWTDIEGATSQHLSFSFILKQTTYFRRVVTELGSGTIAYSDIAAVDVAAQTPSAGAIKRTGSIAQAGLALNSQTAAHHFF